MNDAIPITDLNPGALFKNCVFEKTVYCLGTTTNSYVLFYNLEYFDQAGVPYPLPNHPLSMDEFNASIRQISKSLDKGNQMFMTGAIPLPVWWMDPHAFLSSDGKKIDRFINNETTSAVFQVFADLVRDNSLVWYEQTPNAEMENIKKFSRGELALLIADSSIALPVIERSGISWGAAVVPVEKKTDPAWASAWTDGFGVLSTSHQSEKALHFISYLATYGNRLRIKTGDIPLNMKIADQWSGNDESRSEVLLAIKAAQPGIFLPDNPFLPNLMDHALIEITQKGIPAKKALDMVTPEMQAHLDRAWQNLDLTVPPPKP